MDADKAFDAWVARMAKRTDDGQPMARPDIIREAFMAGFRAGECEANLDASREIRDACAEARMQERLGEDYGTY